MCFVGWKVDDVPYSDVKSIDHFEVGLPQKEDLINNDCKPSFPSFVSKMSGPLLKVRTESVPIELKVEIVTWWCFKRVSVAKQAIKTRMKSSQIRNIIYEFQALRKANKKIGRSLNNIRRKLNYLHVEWISEFVKSHQLNGFTLSEAKAHLLKSFPDLKSISLPSIGNWLLCNLGLSYKKLGGLNINKVKPESHNNLIGWMKLLLSLLNDQCYLIFIDEFTVNRVTAWTYGWAQRGKPGGILIRTPNFKMSFIIAHSQILVGGIIGTKSAFDQAKYKHFLSELISKIKWNKQLDWSKVFFVVDNCVFNQTNLIKQFITQAKLRWIFIPPYSSEINAWEKLINFIKSKVKMMVGKQK